MIRGSDTPETTAASIYGCSRIVSTTERTRRTTLGISGIVMAIMTLVRLAPASATSAMATKMPGMAIKPSMIRMTIASSQRI